MHRTFLALLAVSFALSAADKTYVLKAAHLFDGKSDRVVSPGLVVVTNGLIAAVGAQAAVPAGAEIVDLGDSTLLPGLIDAHTHLTYPYERDYRNIQLDALKKTIPERTLDAVDVVRRTLMGGFTTGERGCDLSQTRGLNCAPPPPGVRDLLPLVCVITGPVPVLVYVVKSIAGLAGDPFSHRTADSEHPPQPIRRNS